MSAETAQVVLVGFGEVGQTLFDDLQGTGRCQLQVYDLLFNDPSSGPVKAASERGLVLHQSAGDAIESMRNDDSSGAQLVLCAVTAAADLEAAQSCLQSMPVGCLYADLNSASPGVKQTAAALVESVGGAYVEAAVMSPIHPLRIAAPMLLGGPHCQRFLDLVIPLGFAGARVHADTVGAASATKMCRSVIIKGFEALMTESMLAARHYGVEDDVLASLSNLLPGQDWRQFSRYMISRSIEHGGRRAEEMREVVKTVEQAGVDPWMSVACVERQQWAPRHHAALEHEDIAPFLDAMSANLEKSR